MISGLKLFLAIYAGVLIAMIAAWIVAANLAAAHSHSGFANVMYLIVGAGFLFGMKVFGQYKHHEFAFGVAAVLVNSFLYTCVIWCCSRMASLTRSKH